MLIHCLRHGTTEANLAGRFNGSGDEPLAEAQRAALREIEYDWTPHDVIYARPLRRAVETAECLRIPTWIPEPRIAERDFGIFEGLTPPECEKRFPEEYAAFRAIDADFAVPGRESRAQNLARVRGAWREDVSRSPVGIARHWLEGPIQRAGQTLSIFDRQPSDVRLVDYGI